MSAPPVLAHDGCRRRDERRSRPSVAMMSVRPSHYPPKPSVKVSGGVSCGRLVIRIGAGAERSHPSASARDSANRGAVDVDERRARRSGLSGTTAREAVSGGRCRGVCDGQEARVNAAVRSRGDRGVFADAGHVTVVEDWASAPVRGCRATAGTGPRKQGWPRR